MNWWQPHARPSVAPSLLAADFACLREELARMTGAGADLFHLDVMDAHFVPNLTFGPVVAAAIRRCTDLPLDAHLMMTRPDRYLEPFAAAGVDALTIHVESDCDVPATLRRIRELGLRPGISLNPGTQLEELEPVLDLVDLVLVMSVQPGFGGQRFREVAVGKIERLAGWRRERRLGFAISVDGGIDAETGPRCRSAGADILVAGTYLFGATDPAAAVSSLRLAEPGDGT